VNRLSEDMFLLRRYIVVPMRPEGTEGWSEERLRELVTRDCMIGVTLAKLPC
jgi:nitrile hydratase